MSAFPATLDAIRINCWLASRQVRVLAKSSQRANRPALSGGSLRLAVCLDLDELIGVASDVLKGEPLAAMRRARDRAVSKIV